jgi:hypothetical protein
MTGKISAANRRAYGNPKHALSHVKASALQIRSITVTVASRADHLFSSEDLTDYVRQQ